MDKNKKIQIEATESLPARAKTDLPKTKKQNKTEKMQMM